MVFTETRQATSPSIYTVLLIRWGRENTICWRVIIIQKSVKIMSIDANILKNLINRF